MNTLLSRIGCVGARRLGRSGNGAAPLFPVFVVAMCAALLSVLTPTSVHAEEFDPSEWSLSDDGVGGFSYGGWGGWGGPPVLLSPVHVMRYERILGLTDGQRETLDEMILGLETEHRRAWVVVREQRADQMHNQMNQRDWITTQAKQQQLTKEYKALKGELLDALYEDFRLALTPEQDAHWPEVERCRRRDETLLQYACHAGERVDLIGLADSLRLEDAEREALKPILDEYAIDLDAALVARNNRAREVGDQYDAFKQLQTSMYSMYQGPDQDPQAMQAAQEKMASEQPKIVEDLFTLYRSAKRVRDLNQQFYDRLVNDIPSQERDRFVELYEKATREKTPHEFPNMSYSRVKQALTTLKNSPQMIESFEQQLTMMKDSYDEDTIADMRRYSGHLRTIEPLSEDQLGELENIQERFEADFERLQKAMLADLNPQTGSAINQITIPLPTSTAMLSRNASVENQWGGYGDNSTNNPQQEYQQKKGELEQEAMNEIREVLTIDQRLIIANN